MHERSAEVVVVGAGLAGMACAITARSLAPGLDLILLEKNRTPGRKLLISGDGQCNITHTGEPQSFLTRYGDRKKGRFVQPALLEYSNRDLIEFIERGGVPLQREATGKIFPVSKQSRDILHVFEKKCKQLGVTPVTSAPVQEITRCDERFQIKTDRGRYNCRQLVIATGGKTWSQTGSTGDGWKWAESLGHTIVPPRSGLAGVIITPWSLSTCAGISFLARSIILEREQNRLCKTSGSVLVTHNGLSGPTLLDMSRSILPGDRLIFSLLDCRDSIELIEHIRDWSAQRPTAPLRSFFREQQLPARLVDSLFESCKLSGETTGSHLSRSDRQLLASIFTRLTFTVTALESERKAMVSVGGVELSEVNRQTMMSRLVPQLYFSGEVLDIDGDCGGFNLQFAWSSGSLAGKAVATAR